MSAWTTSCRAGAYHAPHIHPDSAWSGVYRRARQSGCDAPRTLIGDLGRTAPRGHRYFAPHQVNDGKTTSCISHECGTPRVSAGPLEGRDPRGGEPGGQRHDAGDHDPGDGGDRRLRGPHGDASRAAGLPGGPGRAAECPAVPAGEGGRPCDGHLFRPHQRAVESRGGAGGRPDCGADHDAHAWDAARSHENQAARGDCDHHRVGPGLQDRDLQGSEQHVVLAPAAGQHRPQDPGGAQGGRLRRRHADRGDHRRGARDRRPRNRSRRWRCTASRCWIWDSTSSRSIRTGSTRCA